MKIDFHIHTRYSYDSLMKPEKILRLAKKRGLDGIVICDHNTVKGGLEAQKINKDEKFSVIVGAEISTDAGDVTGLFLHKEIKSRNFNDVVKEIRAQNGKVLLNHPYKGHDLSKIDLSKVDFIEGYNSRLSPEDNEKAIKLAEENNIPILAGSDAHLYNEIGNCYSIIKDTSTLISLKHKYTKSKHINITLSQYIKSIKKRNFMIFVSSTIVFLKHIIKLRRR